MKSVILTTTALFLAGGISLAAAETIIITQEQQPVVKQYIVKQHVAPVELPSDYDLQIGAPLPEDVELHQLEAPDMPAQYEYVVVGNRTLIVDPETREVIQILE